MLRHTTMIVILGALVATAGAVSAATPTAEALVAQAVDAAQSGTDMNGLDIIRLGIHMEETTSDGATETRDYTALFHGSGVENSRVELSHDVTLALSGTTAWAMIRGELDTRPQTPVMAAGTIRQTVFPLLLPYSLRMEGVNLDAAVAETSFDGTPAWVIHISFDTGFFAAPSMVVPWRVFFSRENHQVLGADYLPPTEYRNIIDEGIRYRILKRQDVGGVSVPAQVLMDGIDFNGVENGHVRVTKVTAETTGPLDLSLFISPEAADRMEAGEF